jgi:hypothetical protein
MESSSSSQHVSNMEGSSSQPDETVDSREIENQDAEDDADGDVIEFLKSLIFSRSI